MAIGIWFAVALVLTGIFVLCMGGEETPPTGPQQPASRPQSAPRPPQTAHPGARRAAPSSPPNASPVRPPQPRYRTGQVVKMQNGKPITLGPDGLFPTGFPCCPICRCRNRLYEPQRVFWDTAQDGYRCIHGHRFRKNGWPL